MLKSLYMKLVLILLLLIVSLMAVTGVFLNGAVAKYFIDEFDGMMRSAFGENTEFVQALRGAAASGDAAPELWNLLQASRDILGVGGSRQVFLLSRTGVLLEPAGSDERIDLTPNINKALGGAIGHEQRMGDSFFDCAVPVADAGGAFDYIVYLRDSNQGLNAQRRSLFYVILQALFLGLAFSLLLSLLLSKTMTTPIENLTRGAARVAAGDFSEKIEVHSRDEIGTLTQTFNHMAGVLQKSLRDVEGERDKLSTLFLHMADGVAAFDLDGALLHVNLAALRLLGVSENEPLTYGVFEEAAPFEEAAALRPPDFITREMTIGGVCALKLYIVPFGSGGAESGLMAVLHDVTEQNRLEELRREFVSNVSHELRTPLTGIKSYAETLMEPESLSPEEIQRFSSVIVDEADRMTRLVRDLLTLSRFDYGKAVRRAADFDISELLRRIYDLLRVEAKAFKHNLLLSVGRLPDSIFGDRDQIEQVLINIVTNAIRYTPEGGHISIEADSGPDWVTISVRDNGIGIPQEDMPYIFDRFYRVDKARSRSMGGTGLGLAIAKEIMDNHGGSLDVHSRQGKGTAVTLTLPLTAEL